MKITQRRVVQAADGLGGDLSLVSFISGQLEQNPQLAPPLAMAIAAIAGLPVADREKILGQVARNPDLAAELIAGSLDPLGKDIVADEHLINHVVHHEATGEVKARALSTYKLPGLEEVDTEEICFLREHVTVDEYTHPTPLNAAQLAKLITDHDGPLDGIYCFLEPVDEQVIDAAAKKGVKWICSCGTGHDNKNKPYAEEKGIQLTNAPGALMHTVSETALALTLTGVLNLPEWIDQTHRGRQTGCSMTWGRHEDLQGKNVVIVGGGDVGFETAKRIIPFLPNVSGEGSITIVDPKPKLADEKKAVLAGFFDSTYKGLAVAHPDEAVKKGENPVSFKTELDDETLATADVVILSPALIKESDLTAEAKAAGFKPTEGMVNAEVLSKMKKTALLVNIARGPLVVEEDVEQALRTHAIGGYVTDVLINEWVRPDRLYEAAAEGGTLFYCSGHIASNSRATRDGNMTGRMLANSIQIINGERPLNPVNKPNTQ
ncbi:MAG: NAD(P)-dependent oxidoreductase [Methanobacteriota archaeon]